MIKTQVQIPDELFERAKRVAEAKEWSFAELVRRGLEYMTRVNPPTRNKVPKGEWKLPEPVNLGMPKIPEEEWTEANHD